MHVECSGSFQVRLIFITSMRTLIQRVRQATVTSSNEVIGTIGYGLLIFLGIGADDTENDTDWMAHKCINLRIFEDHQGKMNLTVSKIQGEIMVVSQFTLYGDCSRGHRPSFTGAAPPIVAEKLYKRFIENLRDNGIKVSEGKFGARMEVSLINDGPVTILIESPPSTRSSDYTL